MNKKVFSLLFLPLVAATLTGCNDNLPTEIVLDEFAPIAYVGEEFDLSDCFIAENGFTYSADVYSYHGATYTETKLPMNGLSFTPTTKDPISVVIHASNGKTTISKTFSLDVEEKGDPIEELLINSGASGYADPGFQKMLTKQVAYMRPGENNKSAIAISYSGNDNYYAGGAVFCPNNFRCLDCWTDKTWENAILRFWVYNESEYNINFSLRVKDELTNAVDIDMTQPGNPIIAAAPNEWTEVKIALRPLGITHTLFQNETGTRNDSFTIKANWDGVRYAHSTEELIEHPINMHSYNFYVDDIDVVPASYYPDMITEAPDLMDRLISTQAWYEDNVITESYNFDDQYVKEGVSSIKFDFNGTPNPNGTQGMCINSPTLVEQWDDQTWDDAVVKFWIYNASDTDIKMQLRVLDTVRNFNLDWGGEYYVERVAAPNQWTLVLFSLRRLGINRPLVKDSIHADELTVKFYSPKSSYTFYIDGVNIVDHSEYPDVDNTMVVPSRIETLNDGWENMERDYGWEKGTITTEINEVCTSTNPSSATSRKIQFISSDIASHNANPDYVINPQEEYGDDHLPSFVGKTLEFDVKFSANITNYEIGLKIVAPSWADKIYAVTPVDGEDGWKRVSIDFTNYSEDAEILSSVIRVGFIFNGVDDTNKSTAFAYLDNIFLKSSN